MNGPLASPEREEVRRLFALLRHAGNTVGPEHRRRLLDVADALRMASTEQSWRGRPVVLTSREIDVLAHVALGSRNRELAQWLGISQETVKSYLRNAMTKLGAQSRMAAVERAREVNAIP